MYNSIKQKTNIEFYCIFYFHPTSSLIWSNMKSNNKWINNNQENIALLNTIDNL